MKSARTVVFTLDGRVNEPAFQYVQIPASIAGFGGLIDCDLKLK
jgi:hypothetical protein